jgi:hypothetical protein
LDFDPVRAGGVSGIAATAEEHDWALAKACEVRDFLLTQGFPPLIMMDSGNGAYLLVPIDLPNDKESAELVQRFLETLALLFDDEQVEIDRTMFNAARIIRLAGTMNRKGDDSLERPWRWARLLEVPTEREAIPRDAVERLAQFLPKPETNRAQTNHHSNGARFDLDSFIQQHGIAVKQIKQWRDGASKLVLEHCVFDDTHRGTSAIILQFPSGAQDYRCKHNTCFGRKWADMREKYEPGYQQRKNNRTVEFTVDGELLPPKEAKEQDEEPRPMHREIPPAEPFPLEALGELGAAAAGDVQRATRAPTAICGQSMLATMNLTVMGHVNIRLPHDEIKPVSEYFATLAESGARKTSADTRATAGVVAHQSAGYENHRKNYFEYENKLEAWEKARSLITARKNGTAKENREKWEQELKDLGERPEPPISNTILIGADPTYEGMHRFFREGGGMIAGQFTSEGGAFIGGHSMSDEVRLRTAASLSLFWDGADLPRLRASERYSVLRDRRLALHILIQPRIAQKLFNDPDLVDQELLTRILAVMPEAPLEPELRYQPAGDCSALAAFSARVQALLALEFPYLDKSRPRDGLSPPTLVLDADATRLWIAYHDDIQKQLTPGGDWFPIKGLARKAPEHAARIAATIARFDNDQIQVVTANYMNKGIKLTDFYLGEGVRIREGMTVNEDLTIAADLLKWLHDVWQEPQNLISLPNIYQLGPYAIRDKATAARIVAILQDHGWLKARDSSLVQNKYRREVWEVV